MPQQQLVGKQKLLNKIEYELVKEGLTNLQLTLALAFTEASEEQTEMENKEVGANFEY